jgi:hypothetical protein
MEALLTQRATTEAAQRGESLQLGEASQLRLRALGVLGTVRASIPLELKRRPELSKSIESEIFRLLDNLAAARANAAQDPASPSEG